MTPPALLGRARARCGARPRSSSASGCRRRATSASRSSAWAVRVHPCRVLSSVATAGAEADDVDDEAQHVGPSNVGDLVVSASRSSASEPDARRPSRCRAGGRPDAGDASRPAARAPTRRRGATANATVGAAPRGGPAPTTGLGPAAARRARRARRCGRAARARPRPRTGTPCSVSATWTGASTTFTRPSTAMSSGWAPPSSSSHDRGRPWLRRRLVARRPPAQPRRPGPLDHLRDAPAVVAQQRRRRR